MPPTQMLVLISYVLVVNVLSQRTTTATCPPNEEWVRCVNQCDGCDDRKTCTKILYTKICISGCNCKEGFYRNKERQCVLEALCDVPGPSRCRPDEEYRVCDCEKNCCNRNNPEACSKECLTGCFCRKGLVRDKQGNCINPENCPPHGQPEKCKRDEQYYTSKPDCKNTCENYNNNAVLCPIGKPGCFCKEGLVKRKDGQCVRPEDCSPTEVCGSNSKPSNCASLCPPTCSNRNPVCAFICVKGCVCDPGYIKNENGDCIPEYQCPSICGPNSKQSSCASPCPPTCRNRNPTCAEVCVEGCVCDPGFIQDDFGNCIRESQCPNTGICGPNSKRSSCASPCPPTCRNRSPTCAEVCVEGCVCDPGFIQNDFGNCIPETLCPNTEICAINEVHSNCVNPCNNCEIRGKCQFLVCNKGCDCREGYRRNDQGICIPESQCPAAKCGPNSEYSDCASPCPSMCNDKEPFRICPAVCVKGCVCNRGFINDGSGNCIPESECPPRGIKCKKDEQYYTNKPECKNTCENYDNPGVLCLIGQPGCFCKDGLVKRKDGKCVRPEECSPTVNCGPNSKQSSCASPCPPTCRNRSPTCAEVCVDGCVCDPGFIQNDFGICVLETLCPNTVTCGPNSEYSDCASPCPKTCNDTEPRICPAVCVKGCICNPGFINDGNGNCIPESKCPPKDTECGPNSVYSDCASPCPSMCNDKEPFRICPAVCVKRCVCNPGFINDGNGNCIPKSECPPRGIKCKKDEQYYTNKPECKNTCENYDNPGVLCLIGQPGCFCKEGLVKRKDGKCVRPEDCSPTVICGANSKPSNCASPCPPTCKNRNPECDEVCVEGCKCDPGFIKDDFGKCIPESQCPNTEICGPNEEYSDCINPCNTCESKNVTCNFLVCNKGCDCKPGYTRYLGTCIPENQCPLEICGPNSKSSDCASLCPPTCSDRNPVCGDACVKGCVCDPGYIKNDYGKCIPENQCPATCGPNSKPSDCASLCPKTCSDKKPRVCPAVCVKGCVCNPGFINDGNGNCIPESKCPPKGITCGLNSEYSDCASPCPTTCNGPPLVCSPSICIQGCVCNSGFINDGRGKCIPEDECLPSGRSCGKNEEYLKCGNVCAPTCDNRHPRCLSQIACSSGCFCKKGFIKEKKGGRCIPESQCPSVTCGPNSKYSDCASPCPSMCNDKEPFRICPAVCVKGCVCNRGFINDGNGNCIPKSECPPRGTQCTKTGEEYKSCGSLCEATCTSIRSRSLIKCPKKCKSGCFCKDGLVRDLTTGNCVKPNECGTNETCSKKGEVYKSCGSPCEATCASLHFRIGIRCPKKCKPGCFCRDGLVRDSKNNCVKPNQCQNNQEKCKKNEQFYDCKPICNTCGNYGKNVACPQICIRGCFCKPGLVLREDGECVKPEKCENDTCGKNEESSECGTACPPTCANKNPICTKQCKKGCFCKKGFIRENEDGCCIPESQCPSDTCGKNEERLDCGTVCPPTCANRNPICTKQCKKGCFCKKGFIRENEEGSCVPESQCPAECEGKNEVVVSCAKPKWCNTCNIRGNCKLRSCSEGCDCKPGFYRNSKGICIPQSQCQGDNSLVNDQPDDDNSDGDDSDNGDDKGDDSPGNDQPDDDNNNYDNGNSDYKGNDSPDNDQPDDDDNDDDNENGDDKGDDFPGNDQLDGDNDDDDNEDINGDDFPGNDQRDGDNDDDDNDDNNEIDFPGNDQPDGDNDDDDNDDNNGNFPGNDQPDGDNDDDDNNDNDDNNDRRCPLIRCPADCAVVTDAKSCPKCLCEKLPTHQTCPQIRCKEGCFLNETAKPCPKCDCNKQPGACGPDEEEYECKPFCTNRCNPSKICPRICIKGCFCKKGLVLNDDDKCVKKEECNQKPPGGKKCKKNEQYYPCKPTCNNTCENYGKKGPCPLICRSGCFCKKGLVLRKDGECVKPEECKSGNCGPDKEYYQCKPFCSDRCNPLKKCPRICFKGCYCKKGLVLNDDGKCVRKEDCNQKPPGDKKCKKNEQYYPCKPTCNNTCENYGKKGPCPLVCGSGCFCKKGLVLRKDNKCVKPEQCKSGYSSVEGEKIEEDETESTLEQQQEEDEYNFSENDNDDNNLEDNEEENGYEEESDFEFEEGETDNFSEKEMSSTDSSKKCKKDEKYYKCTPSCKNNCKAYFNPGIRCGCGKPGCFCKEGLVKDDKKGCVHPQQCKEATQQQPYSD